MHKVQLTIQESVYSKFMNFVESFKADEINIDFNQNSSENAEFVFQKNKAELQKDYQKMMSGESESYTIDQLEAMTKKVLSKYETSN